jgi:hypothetical protein
MAEVQQQQEQLTPERLAHYREHPEEVDATNMELLEALALSEMPAVLADRQVEQVVEGEGSDTKAKPEAAKPAAKAEPEPGTQESEEGKAVATKDGKHTLPYEVLKEARDRAAAAEQALAEAQTTALQLVDQVKALRAGRAAPAPAEEHTTAQLQAMVDRVAEEAPWLKESFGHLTSVITKLREEVVDLRGRSDEDDEQAIAELNDSAQAAIEANPTLVLWQEQAPALWNEAVTFDQTLRRDPELSKRFQTFEQRFERVVEMVKAVHVGEDIPLPTAMPASPGVKPAAAAQPSAQETQARARAALAKADAENPVRTLSDIPGGVPTDSADENLERMDIVQVAEKFGRMSPQQILGWVSQSH